MWRIYEPWNILGLGQKGLRIKRKKGGNNVVKGGDLKHEKISEEKKTQEDSNLEFGCLWIGMTT